MTLYLIDIKPVAFKATVREEGRFAVLVDFWPEYFCFTRLLVVFALALWPLVPMRSLLCIGVSPMLHDNLLTWMLLSLAISYL